MKTEQNERRMDSVFELRYRQFFVGGRQVPKSTPEVQYDYRGQDEDEFVQDIWVGVTEAFSKEEDMRLRGINLAMNNSGSISDVSLYEIKRAEEHLGNLIKADLMRQFLKPERIYGGER